jgi:hypothetical protein
MFVNSSVEPTAAELFKINSKAPPSTESFTSSMLPGLVVPIPILPPVLIVRY